jgi:hypothetical protein
MAAGRTAVGLIGAVAVSIKEEQAEKQRGWPSRRTRGRCRSKRLGRHRSRCWAHSQRLPAGPRACFPSSAYSHDLPLILLLVLIARCLPG